MGGISGVPLKHHYIPIFYSKWWTGDDGRLVRYSKPRPDKIVEKRVHPSEVGWARSLYTIPREEGAAAQILETQFFRDVDDHASCVLRKMNDPNPSNLSSLDRTDWTIFVRSLLHRTPDNLATTKAAGVRGYREAIEQLRAKHQSQSNGPRDIESFIATQDAVEMERGVLRNLGNMILNPTLGQFFVQMHWRYIDLPKNGRTFLLSDDPIVRTNGLKNDIGHLAMPISPTRLFVAAYRKETLDLIVQCPPDKLAATVNALVVEGARYFVAATDLSQDRFIKNRFGKNPRDGLMKPYSDSGVQEHG